MELQREFKQLHKDQDYPRTKKGADGVWHDKQQTKVKRHVQEKMKVKRTSHDSKQDSRCRSRSRSRSRHRYLQPAPTPPSGSKSSRHDSPQPRRRSLSRSTRLSFRDRALERTRGDRHSRSRSRATTVRSAKSDQHVREDDDREVPPRKGAQMGRVIEGLVFGQRYGFGTLAVTLHANLDIETRFHMLN